ncbi:S-layer homology domain-containing protein [Alkalihalobacillus oceani]|uniref:S-layer homology domain-containing protein n=1 Tax=Halalkalibacter oceani TaxID=1653776 RepID=A0A9X2IPY8_9BACI|nr:S-layer homology domain-containing protein [Halalkalibacter oceani]MCM3716524.1 S-layer homology domain-containing protein [Halalkalibacter oceani]
MAYQPKSYRKFLATSVTAAMVATVAAPVIPSVSADTSFSDVASNHWAADAINYLVEKGAIEGYPNGTFQPNASITRAEAAKILAITLGLNVDESANTNFSDASSHWASSYIAALQSQAPGVIDGYTDGTFRPNRTITRQEMAKMIVTAYDLQENEAAEVDFTDNTGWGAEYITTLASLGIVEGVRAGQFQPNGNVTRAQTPVFVHRAEVPEVRIPVPGGETPVEFAITSVEALTEEGRFAEVTFSVPANSNITRNDVNVTNARTGERIGIQEVDLSNDRRVLTVTFFENDIDRPILERGETYRFAVTHGGETYTYNFERPQYAEARVIDVDNEEGKLLIDSETTSTSNERYHVSNLNLEVADADIDLEYVLGRDIRVWYNTEDEVVNIEVKDETVHYDAVEVNGDEIELLDLDDEFDFSDDAIVRINGDRADVEDLDEYYDYAKVVLDGSGDVVYVNAYNWADYVVVDEIDGTEVFGYDGYIDVDLEDYIIVKDGETISIDDIEQNDVVFFNDDPENDDEGYAEVFTRTVSGEITGIFEDKFEVDGKLYDYAGDREWEVRYIDEDGDVEVLGTGSDASDVIERFQDAGDVTVFLDRDGNLVFVAGELGELNRNRLGSLLLDEVVGYSQATRDRLEVSVLSQNGEANVYDVRLDSLDEIIVDGEAYDGEDLELIDANAAGGASGIRVEGGAQIVDFSEVGQRGQLIRVHLDNNDNVTKFEFYTDGFDGDGFVEFSGVFEIEKDNFFNGKRIQNSAVVFDTTDHDWNDDKSISTGDVEVSTWAEYKEETSADEIHEALVYYNDRDNVTYLVIVDSDVDSEDADTPALIRSVLRNTDGEIVRFDAYIDGTRQTFNVDEIADSNITGLSGQLSRGDAVYFAQNNNGLVTEIVTADTARVSNITSVSTANRTITGTGGTYELVSDGYVLDNTGSNVEEKRLSDLRNLDSNEEVLVILDYDEDGDNTRFAKFFVIVDAGTTGNDDDEETVSGATVTAVSATSIRVQLEDNTSRTLPLADNVFVDDTVAGESGFVARADIQNGLNTDDVIDYELDEASNTVTSITIKQKAAVELSVTNAVIAGDDSIEVTYSASTVFQDNITSVRVNGTALASSAYDFNTAGGTTTLEIDESVTTASGDYVVTIVADGFKNSTVTQVVDATPPTAASSNAVVLTDADDDDDLTEDDQITLTFSEELSSTSQSDIETFLESLPELGTTATAQFDPDGTSVVITLGTTPTIAFGDTITIDAADVVDVVGNTATADVVFTLPASFN